MRNLLVILALCVSLAAPACSASEDANPAVRCSDDQSCPDALECYRGFCVETDDELPDPAQSIPSSDAGVSEDAAVAVEPVADAASSQASTDAAQVFVQDAPGTSISTVASEPVATTPVVEPAPVAVTPPAVAAPASSCLAQCAALPNNDKACKDCFKAAFGDDPKKLCGEPGSAGNAEMQTLCSVICAPESKGHGPSSICGGQ